VHLVIARYQPYRPIAEVVLHQRKDLDVIVVTEQRHTDFTPGNIDAIVVTDIQNLDLAGRVGHDVAKRFLDAAQTLVRLLHYLDTSSQWHLEARRTLDRAPLEHVVRSDSDGVQLFDCGRKRIGVVVHLSEEDGLVEELNAGNLQALDVCLRFRRHFSNVIEMRHDHRSFSSRSNALEQARQLGIGEPRRIEGDGLRS